MRRSLLLALALTLTAPAMARANEAAGTSADVDAARKVLVAYLDTVAKAGQGKKLKPAEVSKKLEAVKKSIHPKTMQLIGEQEKRKTVTVGLAVWHFAKADYWMTSYELKDVHAAANGTVVANAEENNWRVEEGGEDSEAEPTSYLMAKVDGKWLLIDKRRNGTFDDKSIRAGYKSYFAEEKAAEPVQKAEEETDD